MNHKKTVVQTLVVSALFFPFFTSYALTTGSARSSNIPVVSSITSTSAQFSVAPSALLSLSDEQKTGGYFQYIQKDLVCIDIYPTPESCLPKKTEIGKTTVTVNTLMPNTSYIVVYKHDNTIRCITTPCPTNDFQSAEVEFTTKKIGEESALIPVITRYLTIGSRGSQVIALQTLLNQQGYLNVVATGYYGRLTFEAVKKFQSAHHIIAVGFVGPATRGVLASMTSVAPSDALVESFEGTVTAYSTGCFSDGECSVTVDGKKIVTTIGWSQQIGGKVRGIEDFGAIANNVGAHAKVYARKTTDGYTLYGNSNYYIEIVPKN